MSFRSLLSFSSLFPLPPMDLDIQTVLRWLILGVLVLIGISLLGVLVDVAGALLSLVLKAGVVVLIVLLVIRVLEKFRE